MSESARWTWYAALVSALPSAAPRGGGVGSGRVEEGDAGQAEARLLRSRRVSASDLEWRPVLSERFYSFHVHK